MLIVSVARRQHSVSFLVFCVDLTDLHGNMQHRYLISTGFTRFTTQGHNLRPSVNIYATVHIQFKV